MVDSLDFFSLNVRSIANDKKRKELATWFKGKPKGILFLQETHSQESKIKQWEEDFNCKFICSHGTASSKGAAIVVPNNFSLEVRDISHDDDGRFVILHATVNGEELVLISVYFPTKGFQQAQIQTLNSLKDKITNFENKNIIIGGDFNVALDVNLDKKGGNKSGMESRQFRQELLAFMEAFGFTDVTRLKNPAKELYTWHSKHLKISSRLDYFFVSEPLLNRVIKCCIKPSILTDHRLVHLSLQILPNQTRGPGYWKFNTSLLYNQAYVAKIKKVISNTARNLSNETNKGMVWDLIKMSVRAETIKFCSLEKRKRDFMEKELEREIERLTLKYNTLHDEKILDQIETMKTELESINGLKTKGNIIRARAKWAEEGEKNTSFFLSLEKRNSENKNISQLQINNTIITEREEIMEEQLKFYKSLYTDSQLVNIQDNDDIFLHNEIPTLSDEEQAACEGAVTLDECLNALKLMANNKSPGSDGFPCEFYKFFWIDISTYVCDSLNYAFDKGELSIDQRRGLITLIPKKDKDRLFLKNWRPVALLNTDYKILAKVLSNRIKPFFDKLINTDQTGYIQGRYIGENIRTVSDIISYLKARGMSAVILLIDFEKAFDSVRWSFIRKTLKAFGFGNDLVHWVDILYKNSQSAVINNGYFTSFFNLERGVRQGCPLSVYLLNCLQ